MANCIRLNIIAISTTACLAINTANAHDNTAVADTPLAERQAKVTCLLVEKAYPGATCEVRDADPQKDTAYGSAHGEAKIIRLRFDELAVYPDDYLTAVCETLRDSLLGGKTYFTSRHRHWYIEVWGRHDSWALGTDNGRHDYKAAQDAIGLNEKEGDVVGLALHKDGDCAVEDI